MYLMFAATARAMQIGLALTARTTELAVASSAVMTTRSKPGSMISSPACQPVRPAPLTRM